jgi:hypothetical protein
MIFLNLNMCVKFSPENVRRWNKYGIFRTETQPNKIEMVAFRSVRPFTWILKYQNSYQIMGSPNTINESRKRCIPARFDESNFVELSRLRTTRWLDIGIGIPNLFG